VIPEFFGNALEQALESTVKVVQVVRDADHLVVSRALIRVAAKSAKDPFDGGEIISNTGSALRSHSQPAREDLLPLSQLGRIRAAMRPPA
jgi:hypothetical protein